MRSSAVWTPEKWFFCHYMARFDPIFPLKSGLGSKFPWDGSANPWDGNENPWDVSAETPHTAAFPTLKGGRTCASALTLCHIAHKHCRPFCRPAPRRAATTQSGPRRWDGGRFVWAGCGAAGRYPSRRDESFSSMSRVMLSRSYVGFQSHSCRAHTSSRLLGQLSAMLCLSGSTLYSISNSGLYFLMA